MKNLFTTVILSVFFISVTKAQDIFRINDFSEKYTLIYIIDNIPEKNSPEYFLLYDKTDKQLNKPLLGYGDAKLKKHAVKHRLKASEILYKDMPQANFQRCADYNFDGVKDIIIYDPEIEEEGCYVPKQHANIFISRTSGMFYYNKSLSDNFNKTVCLKNSSFYPIPEKQEICLEQKGSAFSHYYEYFKFESDTLRLIRKSSVQYKSMLYWSCTNTELQNGEWITSNSLKFFMREENPEAILSFDTSNGKGKVFLFKDTFYVNKKDTENLYYVFLIDDETIEFAYPDDPEKADNMRFRLKDNDNGKELKFNSGKVIYTIYETAESVGIRMNVNGKEHDWKAKLSSKKGSLDNLIPNTLNNVDILK